MNTDKVAELLALCNAGTIDHRRVSGRSYGGLTSMDIAAVLHAVQDKAGAVLLAVKYMGRWSELNTLERILLVRIADIASRKGWRTKPHILGNLILQALEDTIPANKCLICNGTKCIEATETTPKVTCPACDGTGQRPDIAQRTRAERLNVSEQSYCQTYKRHLHEIIKQIQSLEHIALCQVSKYITIS